MGLWALGTGALEVPLLGTSCSASFECVGVLIVRCWMGGLVVMKCLRLFGLVAGLLVLGGVLSASAFALPTVLPNTAGTTADGEQLGANSLFETKSGSNVLCTELLKSETVLTINSSGDLGSFHIDLHKCTGTISGIKQECNSLGDSAKGLILLGGEWHLVDDHLTELGVAILFLIKSFHLECSALALLILTGDFLCLLLKPTAGKATLFEYHCIQTKGVPEDKTWWNDEGKEQTAKMESSLNGGAFEEMAWLALFLELFLLNGKNAEVEVHV